MLFCHDLSSTAHTRDLPVLIFTPRRPACSAGLVLDIKARTRASSASVSPQRLASPGVY